MDITITIPKELEPVVGYWESKNSITMADWLTSIAVGNLTSEAKVGYNIEQDKTVTLDTKVKAVDWESKVTAISEVEVDEPIKINPIEEK